MATVARENIGLLNDKITVKVSKEDYFPTFEKKIKEYSKTVNIPGFRKGMVPTGMIKKMYGPSIYTDEVLKTVEKQLYTYLDTEKPEIFAQPLALDADVRKLDLNNPADYEFGFEIGLKPDFEIAPLDKAPVTFYKVKVTDEMVEEEVSRMQRKGGKLVELETVENEESTLNISFVECDEAGEVIEGGINKEKSLMAGDFASAMQERLKGKKVDDTEIAQLSESFEGDKLEMILKDLEVDKDDQTAAEKRFRLTIKKIEQLEKRALEEEFFNEVLPGASVTTEDEFRNKLKEEIEQYWDGQSRNQLHDQLYHYLLDGTHIEFPAEFLKRWLQTGTQEPKTAEQAEEEFPAFSGQLKWTLINEKLVKENNLQVTQEELREAMRIEVMRYFGNISLGDDTGWLDTYIDKLMKDEKRVDATYRNLLTTKVFTFAESHTTFAEKEVTPEELVGMQHHHHH